MRVFWMLLAGALCLLLAACPKDEPTPEGVDQAGMKRPDAYGEKAAEGTTDSASSTEGGTAAPETPPAGDATPPAEGGK